MNRILHALAVIGDRLMRTALDRPLCDWTQDTAGDDER